jgi:hypothetical protein
MLSDTTTDAFSDTTTDAFSDGHPDVRSVRISNAKPDSPTNVFSKLFAY